MSLKVLLYRQGEYSPTLDGNDMFDFKYELDEDPLRSFDFEIYKEEYPFRDEDSKLFLQKVKNIHFVDESDRYAMKEGENYIYPITSLQRYIKEGLVLLKNSKNGIYTHLKYFSGVTRQVLAILNKCVENLLVAYCVETDEYFHSSIYFWEFEIVNFRYKGYPVRHSAFESHDNKPIFDNGVYKLYKGINGVYVDHNFFLQFEYDWKKDLPIIASYIEMEYRSYDVYGDYSKWYEAGVFSERKVFSHLRYLKSTDFFSRRLPIMLIDYMKDGSVRLDKRNSLKYPKIDEILDELFLPDDSKKTFFLVIDVDEVINNTKEVVDKCVFGGWVYSSHIELYNKDDALLLFKALIPEILSKEVIFAES